MAAPLGSRFNFCVKKLLREYTKIRRNAVCSIHYTNRLFESGINTDMHCTSKDPGESFLLPEVQKRLYKIAGFDISKVFRTRQVDQERPKYKLLTDEQLSELQEDAVRRGLELLQMPPFLNVRQPINEVLTDDPEIEGFDKSKFVFTDITFGLPKKTRLIVVREPNGLLRKASWEERDRMLRVYTPDENKRMYMPSLFEEQHLERILDEERYEYILDRACVQFEPDEEHYIRVTRRTYEHIASRNQFDVLRSTRHFGHMAFYFAFYKNIDKLLVDMLQRDLLDDAADLVTIYSLTHPETKTAQTIKEEKITSPTQIVQTYITHDASDGGIVELALQSYEDSHSKNAQSS